MLNLLLNQFCFIARMHGLLLFFKCKQALNLFVRANRQTTFLWLHHFLSDALQYTGGQHNDGFQEVKYATHGNTKQAEG